MIVLDKDFNFYEALVQHGEVIDYAKEDSGDICQTALQELRDLNNTDTA